MILVGLDEICGHLRVTRKRIKHLITVGQLPVRVVRSRRKGKTGWRYFADADTLVEWTRGYDARQTSDER